MTTNPTTAEDRLATLGLHLPDAPTPFGASVPAVQTGNLRFLSGMRATSGHTATVVGIVGKDLDVKAGREAADTAARHVLALTKKQCGSLHRVSHVVRRGVSVATTPAFTEHPRVADAASEVASGCLQRPDRLCAPRLWCRESSTRFAGRAGRHLRREALIQLATRHVSEGSSHASPRITWLGLIGVLMLSCNALAQSKEFAMAQHTSYHTVRVDGLSLFYREAGPQDAPTLLLLHGFPSSSRMFAPLFARLSDHYHLVAPDYPGFGHSDWPDPQQFAYTFDHIASVMDNFTQALGLSHYTLYMQDYGGPVGFRLVLAHPERVQALIVQNAVAHNEGLGAIWATRRAFWTDRPAHEAALRENLLSFATTKSRHIGDDPHMERYDPDLWTDEYAFLNAPGQAQIQTELFYDYRTNVAAYPQWQAWLQQTQPQLLVLWGKHDPSFDIGEPERYRQDVPNAGVSVLDAGHFALDTKADEIAARLCAFMQTQQ